MTAIHAPWAGTPTERFEYCVRNGLEETDHLEVLTTFLVHTKSGQLYDTCLLYTSPSPRDKRQSRMPSSA